MGGAWDGGKFLGGNEFEEKSASLLTRVPSAVTRVAAAQARGQGENTARDRARARAKKKSAPKKVVSAEN